MKAIQLRPYQIQAIDAIQEALVRKQKHIVIEMVAGCGKGICFSKNYRNVVQEKPWKNSNSCRPAGSKITD